MLLFLGVLCGVHLAFCTPASSEITAFASNPSPRHNTGEIIYSLPSQRFFSFLDEAEESSERPSDEELRKDSIPITPGASASWKKMAGDEIALSQENAWKLLKCEGVAATKSHVYFWTLLSNSWLYLESNEGRGIYLHLSGNSKKTYPKKNFPVLQEMPLQVSQKPIRVISFDDRRIDDVPVRVVLPDDVVKNYIENSVIVHDRGGQISRDIIDSAKKADKNFDAKIRTIRKILPDVNPEFGLCFNGAFVTARHEVGFWSIRSAKNFTVYNSIENPPYWSLSFLH